jgi:hypothetical protein
MLTCTEDRDIITVDEEETWCTYRYQENVSQEDKSYRFHWFHHLHVHILILSFNPLEFTFPVQINPASGQQSIL